ncbi:hypothetical protein F8M41_003223 [Gigaspora margarita]|uniref:Uncharacterized protein n=1 Tax=Gigaspora margarita TaxID=4874 RepID=A0A8H3XCC9_GIGMA|nr:hypothetical protein F8M41_003223 [Gigaspora margarita]
MLGILLALRSLSSSAPLLALLTHSSRSLLSRFTLFGNPIWILYKTLRKMTKLPAILESLSDDTKKSIMEWGDVLSDNNSDDDNVNHYGDPLLIIEWNEAGLAQRNIQKATILNHIHSFQGCMPFPNVDRPQSDSLFQVVNRPGIPAQQIICNILLRLQRLYLQRNVPSLGRIYTVIAEKKDTFVAYELYGVFAL